MTAMKAVRPESRLVCGRPNVTNARLIRPVFGWKSVNQISAVATAGTTSGMMKNARTHCSPGSLTSSSNAIAMPTNIVAATKATV